MDLSRRIKNLSSTELPEDLLKLLAIAKKAFNQHNNMRCIVLLNVIERQCFKRQIRIADVQKGIRIYNPQTIKSKGTYFSENV